MFKLAELYLEELKKSFEQSVYWRKIGLSHDQIERGFSSIKIFIEKENMNMSGNLHGGVMMSALDIGMGLAARSLGPSKVATIQLEVRFLQEIRAGDVFAKSKVIHTTRNTAIIEGKIVDSDENLIAYSTSTFKLFW